MLVHVHILFQIAHLQNYFPKEAWLKGDHRSSCHDVPRCLQYSSKFFREGILVQISGHSSLGNRNNLGASVILTCVYAEIASLVALAIPGRFEELCPFHLRR